MNVLMIGNDPSVKGGITSVITQLMDYDWDKYGIKMEFIPSYINSNIICKALFFIKAYRNIKKKLRSKQYDIAHIHMSYRGSFVRKFMIHKLCKRYGVKDIIHLHGSEFAKWYNESNVKKQKKIRTLLRECNILIVLGEEWKNKILSFEPQANTVVLNNTVRIPDETISWNDDEFKFLFMGVLIKRKGVSDLLEALALLKQDECYEKIKFFIAGTGNEEDSLKEETVSLGIKDKVEFKGWVDGETKKQLFKECQALVLPSYNEGLPIAVLEGISYGMPIVATNVGDIPSAVLDGVNGYLIKPGDVKNLSESIKKVSTYDTFINLSRQSEIIAKNNFSESKYFDKIVKIYNYVISNH